MLSKNKFPVLDGICELWTEALKVGSAISTAFKEEWSNSIKQMEETDRKIDVANKADVTNVEVEFLQTQRLMQIAQSIAAPGADGIAVFRIKGEDGAAIINLANVKGRELLSPETNKYAIIKAGALSADVKELFADGELQILN